MYGVYRHGIRSGVWERFHWTLRERLRQVSGKKSRPTVTIVASQSVRTAEGGIERGYDGGKKITVRKRHIVVDTLGLLIAVVVTGARVDDAVAEPRVLKALRLDCFLRLEVVWADQKYRNHELNRAG